MAAESEEIVEEPETEAEAEAEADVRHVHFKATKTQTRRIDQFLVDRLPYLSRAGVQRLLSLIHIFSLKAKLLA